jgi:hypothetical protein
MSYQANVGEIKLDASAPSWVVNLVAALESVPIAEAELHLTKLRNEVCLRNLELKIQEADK